VHENPGNRRPFSSAGITMPLMLIPRVRSPAINLYQEHMELQIHMRFRQDLTITDVVVIRAEIAETCVTGRRRQHY
jgi:hypothetical protein